MDSPSYVYILASRRNGTLYTGVTADLTRRVFEHKNKIIPGFASKYNVDKLVHYEAHANIVDAIDREKILKRWMRTWKLQLIEKNNPEWDDLYEGICA